MERGKHVYEFPLTKIKFAKVNSEMLIFVDYSNDMVTHCIYGDLMYVLL